ncbi:MAG: hypothetical protein Q9P44_03970 [Anaerolineae bacterium]|nr:hypothetical protein [Anaerolineae bacterium]
MPTQLSEQARNILQLIAEGYTFEQILTDYSASHIQTAAHEALAIDAATHPSIHPPNKRVKTNVRTYEVWTEKEDSLLLERVENGVSLPDIATELERHPMTIRRRITQLGLDEF